MADLGSKWAALTADPKVQVFAGSFPSSPRTLAYNAPGLAIQGNLDINRRPRANIPPFADKNATVYSTTVERDGLHYVIPTIVGGKWRPASAAVNHFVASGQHFGAFHSPAQANAYSKGLHQQQMLHSEDNRG